MSRAASRAAVLALAGVLMASSAGVGRAAAGDTIALLGSARSSALSAGVATGGGIDGMQDNISSLATQEGWAVSGTYLAWLAGARVGQLDAAAPTPVGVVGLSFGGFTAGRVDVVEDSGPARTVEAQRDLVASAGFARSLLLGIEAGIAYRWYRSTLAETWVATASAVDAGARFTSTDGDLTLGASVTNAVATSLRYADERRVRTRALDLMLAVDYIAAGGGADAQCAGVEARLVRILALRAGVRKGGDTTSLSAGIGATWRHVQFDYAVASPAKLGTVSRATMTVGL